MRCLILASIAASLFAQPTVSDVRADYVPAPNAAAPHSYFRVRWDLSGSACYHRIQYGKTSGYGNELQLNGCQQNDLGATVSGLAPATVYHFAVQSSSDGVTYSALSTDATFTTAVLPAPHPAPPQLPATWDPGPFPNTSGYLTATVGANCTSPTLQSLVNTAVTNQPTNGTIITIPAALVTKCGTVQFPDDTQSATVTQNSTNISTSTGTFSNVVFPAAWTPANNDAVVLAAATCLPDSATHGNGDNSYNSGINCKANGQLTSGYTYYLKNVSGGGPYSYQLSATMGGSAIIPGDTGGAGAFVMQKATPLNSHWIILTTDTPDSSFCPQGVRCMGSVWASKMGTIQAPGGVYNGTPGIKTGVFTHNVWLRGIELTWSDASMQAGSTVDPEPGFALFWAPYGWMANNIVIDRSYLHGLSFPNRYQYAIAGYGGINMAVIDSDFENLDYWNPNVTPTINATEPSFTRGFWGTVTSQVLTIIPGVAYMGGVAGANTCTTTGNVTFTLTGGSATGTAYAYFAQDCTPTLKAPTGTTATCTGSATDQASGSHACSFLTAASPDWPRDGNNGINGLTIGTFPLTSGVAGSLSVTTTATVTMSSPTITVTSGSGITDGEVVTGTGIPYATTVTNISGTTITLSANATAGGSGITVNFYTPSFANQASVPISQWTNGGTGTVLAAFGCGPGPFAFNNNYAEGIGIGLFADDGCIVDPIGISIQQNTFEWLQQYKTGWSGSNNYQYLGRNGPELKHGRGLLFNGNILKGFWAGISASGDAALFHSGANNGTVGTVGGTGYPGYTVQDLQITNNSCINTATCFAIGDNSVSNVTPIAAAARVRISNNLMQSVNGFLQNDGNSGNSGNGGSPGDCFELGGQLEDFVFDHNTCYDNRGTGPYLFHWVGPIASEGLSITNNLLFTNLNTNFITSESANVIQTTPSISGVGATLWQEIATSDPNTPAGTFSGNVIAPYYSTFGGYPTYAPSSIVSYSSLATSLGCTLTGNLCAGTMPVYILTGASAAANLASIGFTSTASGMVNLKLLYSSTFVSGGTAKYSTDGTDVGVNMNALLTAQGAVNPPTVLSITATTATISWFAYDGSIACAVDYATSPNDPSTQTGGGRLTASAGNSQSVGLTGLSALTTYNYRVLCPVNQPVGAFTTP